MSNSSTKSDSDLEHYSDADGFSQKGVKKRDLRRLLRFIAHYRWLVVLGLVLILAGTAAALMESRIFGYAIDEAIVPKNLTALNQIGMVFLLVECVRISATIAHSYVFALVGQYVMQDLRLALFSHLQRLSLSVHDRNPAGRLVTRVTNDIAALAEMFSSGFVTILSNFLVVVGTLIWLYALDLRLALISTAVFPLLLAASVYFSGRLKTAYREARAKLSALNAFFAENLLGMRVVHLFNRQKLHLGRFERINQAYADAQISSVKVFALFQPSITWASGIAMALLIWYGGVMAHGGALKIGVLISFFAYVLALFQPVREIADKWNIFVSGMASAERIFSILDWSTELESKDITIAPQPLEEVQGRIVFENVWFAYDAEHWVLRNFSAVIEPGMRVGIVGHTGAGKTTIISLLMRFYDPQKGRILLDGKDLREYDKRSLRSAVGIIQQDVFLFSGAIRDNITLWRDVPVPMIPMEGFQLTEEKLGMELLERGVNLSAGERQILAFARALATGPRIWILDEATANVDSDSERQFQLALEASAKGRTAILIAHRLATVRSADQILVLHKGELVESGNHAHLMRINGLYSRLYRYQAAIEDQPRKPITSAQP